MSISAKTRTGYTLDDFKTGDVIALSTAALGDRSLNGIMYARVVATSPNLNKLFVRNDTYKRDFTVPLSFVSHKMFSDA